MATLRSGTRNWLILVGVLIVAVVVSYFVGQGIESAKRAKDLAAAQQRYTAATQQISNLKSANSLLTANVWAYRASVAIDNRNFGVANDAVGKVVSSLSGVDAGALKIDKGSLAAAQSEAAGLKISVATNLQPQRTQVVQLAMDITALANSGPVK